MSVATPETPMNKTNYRLLSGRFILVCFLNFLIMTGSGIINVLYPLHLENMGKDEYQVGYIMGFFALAGLFARFFAGHQLDRWGRIFFVRMGPAVLILTSLLYSVPTTNNFYLIFVRILHGFSYGVYFTAIYTWIADYAPPGRMAESIGIFGLSGLSTIATGPLIGEFILAKGGNNFLGLFAAAALLVGLGLIMTRWMEELYVREPHRETSVLKVIKALGRLDILSVVLITFLFGVGTDIVFTFMAPFVRHNGLGEVTPFFTAYTVGALLLRLFSGRMADRSGRMALIIPSMLILAVGLSYLSIADNFTRLMIIGFFLGCAHGIHYPAIGALMMDRVAKESRGAGMGAFSASSDIGYFLGVTAFGRMVDFGGFNFSFTLSGIVLTLGLLIFMGIEKIVSRKSTEETSALPENQPV